eukprot:XP_011676959.1 PREDICTED: lambda-crystallin [Strongylocentrotus purpuratus]
MLRSCLSGLDTFFLRFMGEDVFCDGPKLKEEELLKGSCFASLPLQPVVTLLIDTSSVSKILDVSSSSSLPFLSLYFTYRHAYAHTHYKHSHHRGTPTYLHTQRRSQSLLQINPPYYAPLVEIIPAPWTNQSAIARTRTIMESIGQEPVTLKKEVPGFAVNRIQYAIIAEVWRLVEGGVLSADDVDKVMSAGLGLRYAFLGPLEVMHLNAEGMQSYMERYTQSIQHVLGNFGPTPTFTGSGLERIIKEMDAKIPLDKLEERRQWRDTRLAALAKLKRDLEREGK